MDNIKLLVFTSLILATTFNKETFAHKVDPATVSGPAATNTVCPCQPLNETFGTTAGCASTTVQSSAAYPGIQNLINQTYGGGNNNTDAPNDGYYAVRCNNTNGWNGQWFDLTKGMTDADGVAGGNYLVVNSGLELYGSTATGYNPYEFYHKTVSVCAGATYSISFKAGNLSTYNSGNPNSCSYGGLSELQLYAMPGGTAVQPTVVAGTPTPYSGAAGTCLLITSSVCGSGGTGLGMTCASTGFVWHTYSANYTVPAGQTTMDVVLLSSYLKAAGNDFAVDDITVDLVQCCGFTCSASPVQLISFTTEKSSQNVTLRWSTASELNNDYFSVEKSADGINFDQIGIVKGNGNSKQIINYSFDDNSFNTGTIYYRLKQVDIDGKFEYSMTRAVDFGDLGPVTIFNNDPSNQDGGIIIRFNKKGSAAFSVIDLLGRVVYSGTRESDAAITLNKNILGSGIYIVKVFIGNELISKKVVLN